MDRNEDANLAGRLNGEQPETPKDAMGQRLLYMVLIWVMLSVAQTVLTLLTVVQFVIMLVNTGEKNQRLANFGTDRPRPRSNPGLGPIWIDARRPRPI